MPGALQESLLNYKGDVDTVVSATGYVSTGNDANGRIRRSDVNFSLKVGPSQRRGRLPKISCLMPTKGRFEQAKFAIASYRAQTWPNRELVVLDQNFDQRLGEWIATLNDPTIRYLSMPGLNEPLGVIRNRTLDVASGDMICTWDDDDMRHPARLEIAVAAMASAGTSVCVLVREMVWAPRRRRVGICHARFYCNSLLISRGLRFQYPPLPRGEDWEAVKGILAQYRTAWIDLPELYLYVAHGNNTMDEEYQELSWQRATDRTEGDGSDSALARLSRTYPIAAYQAALGLAGQ